MRHPDGRMLPQVVPTLEAKTPAIRTWRQTNDGGPANLPTQVIYMDLPVSPLHSSLTMLLFQSALPPPFALWGGRIMAAQCSATVNSDANVKC